MGDRQYKDRRWADYEPGGPKDGQSLAPWLTMLNDIRRAHPAPHWLRNRRFHQADNDQVLVFSKAAARVRPRRRHPRRGALRTHNTRDTWIYLDMRALDLDRHDGFVAHDLVTGQRWNWNEHDFVRLGPEPSRCTSSTSRRTERPFSPGTTHVRSRRASCLDRHSSGGVRDNHGAASPIPGRDPRWASMGYWFVSILGHKPIPNGARQDRCLPAPFVFPGCR
jgi:hypothetical protein